RAATLGGAAHRSRRSIYDRRNLLVGCGTRQQRDPYAHAGVTQHDGPHITYPHERERHRGNSGTRHARTLRGAPLAPLASLASLASPAPRVHAAALELDALQDARRRSASATRGSACAITRSRARGGVVAR